MINVRIGLETLAVCVLQFAQLTCLRFMRVDRKTLVDEKLPDLFVLLPGVKSFVLGVADPAEFLIRPWGFRAVTLPN